MAEPILIGLAPALVTGLIVALANVFTAFGVGITQIQVNALNAAVLPVMLVMAAVGGWWARRNSTPTAAPRIAEGTTVTVVTPADQPNRVTTV